MEWFREKYIRGGNSGAIQQNGKAAQYIATTATKSRTFKTIVGARRFMETEGYRKLID